MHSSRMRNARLSTVSRSIPGLCIGGEYPPQPPLQGDEYPPRGENPLPSWTEWLTDACKNINFVGGR